MAVKKEPKENTRSYKVTDCLLAGCITQGMHRYTVYIPRLYIRSSVRQEVPGSHHVCSVNTKLTELDKNLNIWCSFGRISLLSCRKTEPGKPPKTEFSLKK